MKVPAHISRCRNTKKQEETEPEARVSREGGTSDPIETDPREPWDVSDSDSDTTFSFSTKLEGLVSLRNDSSDERAMSSSEKKNLGKTKELGFWQEEGRDVEIPGFVRENAEKELKKETNKSVTVTENITCLDLIDKETNSFPRRSQKKTKGKKKTSEIVGSSVRDSSGKLKPIGSTWLKVGDGWVRI